jgi:hypothetical protein
LFKGRVRIRNVLKSRFRIRELNHSGSITLVVAGVCLIISVLFRTRLENVILKIKVLDCGPLEEFLGRPAHPDRIRY